jgi:hypothetical protein
MCLSPAFQVSTIAELVFSTTPIVNFAHLVSQLDKTLTRFSAVPCRLRWEAEHWVSFEMPGTRIGLAQQDFPRNGVEMALCISVGPSDIAARGQAKRLLAAQKHPALCSRLADHLHQLYPANAILWYETQAQVDLDLLECLSAPRPRHDRPPRALPRLDDTLLSALLSRDFDHRRSQCLTKTAPSKTDALTRLRAAITARPSACLHAQT